MFGRTKRKNIRLRASFVGPLLVVLLSFASIGPASAADDPIYLALSARHQNYTTKQLEDLAGGADQLVTRLLELRTDNRLPYVSIRAEKLLLEYSDRSDVSSALESDVVSPGTKGLARAIALNVDSVSDASTRERIARAVVGKAQADNDFLPYAKQLIESKDATVSRLAREGLR